MEIYEVPHTREHWFRLALSIGLIILIIRVILRIGKLLEVFLYFSLIDKM